MRVRVRHDIQDDGDLPATSSGWRIPQTLMDSVFECIQPDWANANQYNMLITTKWNSDVDGGAYVSWVKSVDFEFLPDDNVPHALITALMKEVAALRDITDEFKSVAKAALKLVKDNA